MKHFIIITAILISLMAAPTDAADITAGAVVKFANEPTVYYVNQNLALEPYFSKHSFFSWGHDFNEVRVLDASLTTKFTRGSWQSLRPGSLIKAVDNPKVYLVTALLQIEYLENPAEARELAGAAWEQKIVTLSPAEFNLYQPASAVSVAGDRRVVETTNPVKKAIDRAMAYLKTQSLDWWSVIALASAKESVALNNLMIENDSLSGREKTIIGLVSAGHNPQNYYQRNLTAEIKHAVRQEQIGDPRLLNDDTWGILALRAAGLAVDDVTVHRSAVFLSVRQNSDHGWSFMIGQPSDTNDTAITIIALLEAGFDVADSSVVNGLDYLARSRNADNGYGFFPDSSSDTASTAWVMSALYRAGQPVPQATIDYLLKNQQPDGGFSADHTAMASDALSTAYALVALSKEYYQPNHD